MANNKIEASQQQSQGVTIGTQGNQDMPTPEGTAETQQAKDNPNERQIPNQDRSSAANQQQDRS